MVEEKEKVEEVVVRVDEEEDVVEVEKKEEAEEHCWPFHTVF